MIAKCLTQSSNDESPEGVLIVNQIHTFSVIVTDGEVVFVSLSLWLK